MTRRCLYKWRTKLEAVEPGEEAARPSIQESAQRKEILQLKRLLAEKAIEVDFLKGALQKVEARRQRSSGSGARLLLQREADLESRFPVQQARACRYACSN